MAWALRGEEDWIFALTNYAAMLRVRVATCQKVNPWRPRGAGSFRALSYHITNRGGWREYLTDVYKKPHSHTRTLAASLVERLSFKRE